MSKLPPIGSTVEIVYTGDRSDEQRTLTLEVESHTDSGTGFMQSEYRVTNKGLVFAPSPRTGNRVKVGHDATWTVVEE